MENNSLKETVIDYCLNVLKRDDIKNELKQLMRPMMDVVLQEIYPYIFLSMIFVFINLNIFSLTYHRKIKISKLIYGI